MNEFFTTGRECSFGYQLADNGFDLWGANFRTNRFSRKHKTLKLSDPEFWDYTYDDAVDYEIYAFVKKVYEVL